MQRVIRQTTRFNLDIPGSAERPELYRGHMGQDRRAEPGAVSLLKSTNWVEVSD